MTLFWLAGAALAAVVLLLLARPLLKQRAERRVSRRDANIAIYRDQLRELDADLAAGTLAQADHARARREIEARLLEDVPATPEGAAAGGGRALAAVLAAALPALALGVYLLVGNPAAIEREAAHDGSEKQLEALVDRLAARLRESPDDAEGWKLLGRSSAVLGRFSQSAEAYARAAALEPRDAQVLADLADSLAMSLAQGGKTSLQGEPEKLARRALELDPQNLKALALAGTAAFERKDFGGAVRYWQRMLPLVAADSEDARSIRASIEEAKALMKPGAATASLRGSVRLSPDLKAKASPDDTVFIFARAVQGPPMPLAVKRAKVRDLPLQFALDDSMAMAPGLSLSAHARVVVGARVSKSGQPAAQAGDLQGLSAPVANDAQGVSVVIDSVVRGAAVR